LGPEVKGEENGEEMSPSSSNYGGLGERHELSHAVVQGGAPAEYGFIVIYSSQIASVDSR